MGSFSVVSPELRRLFPLVNVSASTAFAARRIRTCNQGIQGPSRFHEAWTISSSAARSRAGLKSKSTPVKLEHKRGGRCSWAGIIVGAHPASL